MTLCCTHVIFSQFVLIVDFGDEITDILIACHIPHRQRN